MEIEIKTNKPFDYENVIVVISINSTDGCEPTAEVFAMYKESEAREMLLEDFKGTGEEASIHVDNLLKKGNDVVKMGTTTKFFTCRTGKLMTKKVNEISEKSKQILTEKGYSGDFGIKSISHLLACCGYKVDVSFFACEEYFSFKVRAMKDVEVGVDDNSGYEEVFDSTWEGYMHDCEMLYDSTEEAYVDGLNFVIAEYIEPENYAFSKE